MTVLFCRLLQALMFLYVLQIVGWTTRLFETFSFGLWMWMNCGENECCKFQVIANFNNIIFRSFWKCNGEMFRSIITFIPRTTYLLTAWCRVLLEQLTGLQIVKKFPAFHGTRRFITALTSVRHLSLFWASPIQSIYPHSTSWRSILILSTHLCLGLPSGLFPSGFPSKIHLNIILSSTPRTSVN